MWLAVALAVLAVLVVLFLLPPTRPAVLWLILTPMTLWIVRFRLPIRAGFGPEPIAEFDPRLTEPCRAAMGHTGGEVRSLGFEECGLFALERGPRQPVTVIRMYAHRPARASATLSCVIHGQVALPGLRFCSRALSGRRTVTTSTRTPEPVTAPGTTVHHLPSLRSPADLWAAHRALCEREPGPEAAPPATDAEGARADLLRDIESELEQVCAAGLMRRIADGSLRFTWRGALAYGLAEVWPRRVRIAARVRAEEDRLMAGVGLTEMLGRARAGAPPEPAPERAVLRLNDDRGVARVIARSATGAEDERAGDPRFRALLAQSANARWSVVGRDRAAISGVVGACTIMLVEMLVPGAPMLPAVVLAVTVVWAIAAVMLRGRGPVAERAAADVLLRRGMCASCLYPLESLTPASDGCLVCPECGAAWKRERVREFDRFGGPPGPEPARRLAGAVVSGILGDSNLGIRGEDHLGVACRLVSTALRHEVASAPEATRARLIAARRQMRRSGRAVRIVGAVVIGLVCWGLPLGLLAPAIVRGPIGSPPVFVVAWALLIGAMMVASMLRSQWGCQRYDVVRAMLDQRLCPSCAESLDGRDPDSYGIVRCVCGRGWRVGRSAMPPAAVSTLNHPDAATGGATSGGPS